MLGNRGPETVLARFSAKASRFAARARAKAMLWAAVILQNAELIALGRASLRVVKTIHIGPVHDVPGAYSGSEPDPQIYFARFVPGAVGYRAARVDFSVEVLGEPLLAPLLYVGKRGRFDDFDCVPLFWNSPGILSGHIADVAHLEALRLDPSEGPCNIRLTSARLQISRRLALIDGAAASDGEMGEGPGLSPVAANTVLDGVRIIRTAGVEAGDAFGEFDLTDDDPQILLALDEEGWKGASLARITFTVDGLSCALSAPRLYLDYGDAGFSQAASFPLAEQRNGSYVALVAMPAMLKQIRWDPSDRRGRMRLMSIEARPQRLAELEAEDIADPLVAGPAPAQLGTDVAEARAWADIASGMSLSLNAQHLNQNVALGYDYSRWLKKYGETGPQDRDLMLSFLARLERRPTFSFVMPTFNTPIALLNACIHSMLNQIYDDFEICIADDCSTDPAVREALDRWASADKRIKVIYRPENGHISEASNSALSLATGDYIVLMDHDDAVPEYCLLVIAHYLNCYPEARILFSDEDKLTEEGERVDPYFKSEFNEFLMYGHNMVSHIGVYERELVGEVDGFQKGYEGSQDYDLFLRCMERCGPGKIVHIPHVLYHWRITPGSTAMSADQKSYAIVAAQKSLNASFARRKLPFVSVDGVAPGLTGLQVAPTRAVSVSIIIPSRDQVDLLQACITALAKAPDADLEIIIVDNGTTEPAAVNYLEELSASTQIRVVRSPGPFNFSLLCNQGVEAASGEIICLLNNDTELLSPCWLERARAFLSIESIGAVGARLLYPDHTVQHFGLTLGMGTHRIAGTPHRGLPESAFGAFGKARLVQEFSAVTAACLFVRRADYQEVGGFDLDLPVAYNDIDFCLKLRARGLKVICDPDILLIHKESKSRGADLDAARASRLDRDAALLHSRWGAVLENDPYYSPNFSLSRDDSSLAEAPRVTFPWRNVL